ncbi:hypothetical protein M1M07_10815 [Rhodococcus sp. HM1]|uniref:hypothetical protein n=1 Tax=Rhodococcus sp. HM1 TaxID=2937759 RepID=UPI00200A6DAF|nr:hypothetical protein [Rhodococcus sp. HM1]MCK8671608.1 hypothetical protein [Rhodococcus sp. HM1]
MVRAPRRAPCVADAAVGAKFGRRRALGAGTANTIARMMTFASTFILAALLSAMGFTSALIFLVAAMILIGLILSLFGQERSTLRWNRSPLRTMTELA